LQQYDYCFAVNGYSSSLHVGVVESFLQELHALNLEGFKNISAFKTFLAIFAAI
jgi:hypothetical protein